MLHFSLNPSKGWGDIYGIVANLLGYGILVNKFRLQFYYIHFQTYTLHKGMNPLFPQL